MEVCLRLLALSSLLVGCGAVIADPAGASGGDDGKSDGPGTGSGPGSGTGQGPPASQFLVQIGMLQCDHAFSCRASYPGGDTVFIRVFGPTQGACYADAAAFYQPARVELQIARGKIAYDADAAAKCLSGTTLGGNCTAYWQHGTQFDPACNDALVGQVADGDDCETGFDCAGATSSCDTDLGVCVPD